MEIKAKVVGVCDLESGTSAKGEWKRATIIVEYLDGDYPHKVALTNMKNAEAFSKLQVGATGTFDVNINSREYQGKFYTTIDCWRWNMDAAEQTQQAPASAGSGAMGTTAPSYKLNVQPSPTPIMPTQAYTAPAPTAVPTANSDDLPF